MVSGSSILPLLLLLCLSASSYATNYAQPHVEFAGEPGAPPSDTEGSSKRGGSLQALVPSVLLSSYSISPSTTAGTGKVIAIISAYGSSTVEADLAVFTAQYGLIPCTIANGCLKKVDQAGGSNIPADDLSDSWGLEAAMAVQVAHTIAPGARKVLVCAKSSSVTDLFAAVQYAANTLRATVISMGWGSAESASMISTYDNYFASTATSYFASSGNDGSASGIWYPASSSKVIAVGGTSLYTSSGAFSSEQGWPGSGGGCSAFTPAIQAQASYAAVKCGGMKVIPDASQVADPNSGVRVYYTGLYKGAVGCAAPNCWYSAGGTSLSALLLASRAAARGTLPTPASVYNGGYIYRDITIGSNGAYSCTAGQDMVTGVGSLLG